MGLVNIYISKQYLAWCVYFALGRVLAKRLKKLDKIKSTLRV